MRVGFTGTHRGCTLPQKRALRALMESLLEVQDLSHGDCVGSDAQAHGIARELGWRIEIHPGKVDASKRAFCKGAARIYPPLPPLDRNHKIVDKVHLMIATPKDFDEELRSGTWATVRYAHKHGKPVKLVLPDGRVEDYRGNL